MEKSKKIIAYLLLYLTILLSVYNSHAQVRGVWVTNVASTALDSKANIQACVHNCKRIGITDIFMVVYNNATTMYPSRIMDSMWGIPIQAKYAGRDPLQEMILAAHKQHIRVHAWFEFGFSSSYKAAGGIILKKKPSWAAINSAGTLVTKNGFDWLNAFDPAVQAYMLSLITEVVSNYNIDGIQGDDRLPACPSTAGYDDYTLNLYAAKHQGAQPPINYKDTAWVQWRSNILTQYLRQVYRAVKALKPQVLVTMAPSVYPWCKQEYLQDWPAWLQQGIVDLVMPQVYRYHAAAYDATIATLTSNIPSPYLHQCYPGVLQSLGNGYLASDTLTQYMVQHNRNQGYSGEVFFYYQGIAHDIAWYTQHYKHIQAHHNNATQELIIKVKNALKYIPHITVLYNQNKLMIIGTVTAQNKIKINQILAAAMLTADVSKLYIQ